MSAKSGVLKIFTKMKQLPIGTEGNPSKEKRPEVTSTGSMGPR